MSDQERLDRYSETIWTTSRNDEGTISATGAQIVARAVVAVADAEQAELRAEVERLRVDASAAYVDGYDQGNVDGQADAAGEVERLRAEVARLLAECVDRESERGDLRDRVQKAEPEVESLRRWKAEATEVILGLQDVGRALGLRLGERITGTSAAEAAKRLTERAEKAEGAVPEGWSVVNPRYMAELKAAEAAVARVEALADHAHVVPVQTLEGAENAPVVWPHEIYAAIKDPS